MATHQDQIEMVTEQVEKLRDGTTRMHAEMAALTVVIRQSVASQNQINGKLDRLMDDHEMRLRAVETFKVDLNARLPMRLMSAELIEKYLKEQDKKISDQTLRLELMAADMTGKIDGITKTLAKWGGVFIAIYTIAQFSVPPLIKWAFGGGS